MSVTSHSRTYIVLPNAMLPPCSAPFVIIANVTLTSMAQDSEGSHFVFQGDTDPLRAPGQVAPETGKRAQRLNHAPRVPSVWGS